MPTIPIPELSEKDKARFWANVDKRGPDECWPWRLSKSVDGYGKFKARRKNLRAHVIAFVLGGGDFHSGPLVRHFVCRNRACCNSAHLASGTHRDNNDDRERDGMTARGERNGARLHPERLSRGDSHYSRQHPEKMARGATHGSKTHPEKLRRGRGVWHLVKLTEQSVREIRVAAEHGKSYARIGLDFGVVGETVSRIVRRKTWKHI